MDNDPGIAGGAIKPALAYPVKQTGLAIVIGPWKKAGVGAAIHGNRLFVPERDRGNNDRRLCKGRLVRQADVDLRIHPVGQ